MQQYPVTKKDVRCVDKLVLLKSSRCGLEIHLDPQAEFWELQKELEQKLEDAAKFFRGAKMAVEFKNRHLSQNEEEQLLDLIEKTGGVQVFCVIEHDQTKEMTYKSVIERTMSSLRKREGQFYRGTLRKRQVLESDTSILILGDVECGAKVIAKGSIVVLGRLEGTAYAGICGDPQAYVAALSMQPGRLRINTKKATRSQLLGCRQFPDGPQIAVADDRRLLLHTL